MKSTTLCARCGGPKCLRAKMLCFACRQWQKQGDLLQRFWSKVDNPGVGGACWLWMATPDKNGYGRIGTRPGHSERAHRFSYELYYAVEVPINREVCHSCDNPSCVNPAHLFLGTQADNVRDCLAKGRFQRHNAEKTHCKRGHEFTPENTRHVKDGRQCRACASVYRTAPKRIRLEAPIA